MHPGTSGAVRGLTRHCQGRLAAQYEATVEIYHLSSQGIDRLHEEWSHKDGGFGPVCWEDGKPGIELDFRVWGATPEEATSQARLHVLMTLGRCRIGVEGLEIAPRVDPRPDTRIRA
jgi:hypothetical protein